MQVSVDCVEVDKLMEEGDRQRREINDLKDDRSLADSTDGLAPSSLPSVPSPQKKKDEVYVAWTARGLGEWRSVTVEECRVRGRQGQVQKWRKRPAQARMCPWPFAEGGMRRAYRAEVRYAPSKETHRFVFKTGKTTQDECQLKADVHTQAYAQWWAQLYNERNPAKEIRFLDAYMVYFDVAPFSQAPMAFAAERFVEGVYVKHNNNAGWVGGDDDKRNTPHTFSHFTYELSEGKVLIVDIQGVSDNYTDPQVHTPNREGFGMGNLGPLGIARFFQTHQCSALCRQLQLKMLVNAMSVDSGTERPKYKKEDAKRWLRQRLINPADLKWRFSSVSFLSRDIRSLIEVACHYAMTLEELHLNNCNMRDEEAIELLAVLNSLPKLHYLSLGENSLTDASCSALERNPPLNLTTLNLSNNKMTADGVERLVTQLGAVPGFRLRVLIAKGNPLSTEGIERLRRLQRPAGMMLTY